MISRSVLTAIIGFLLGSMIYFTITANSSIVLIFGGVGYLIGLFLDNAEVKHQLEAYHFSSVHKTQDIIHSEVIPEAGFFYSPQEVRTTVIIGFKVETKSQSSRLSVLKNLQDHKFRIIEFPEKTILKLILDFPETNHPKIFSIPIQKEKFLFNVKERSIDFKNAIEKIVPGLVLTPLKFPDPIYCDEDREKYKASKNGNFSSVFPPDNNLPSSIPSNSTQNTIPNSKASPSSNSIDQKSVFTEIIDYPQTPELEETSLSNISRPLVNDSKKIDESEIMDDLLAKNQPEASSHIRVPDLSPEDVQQLRNSNDRQLDSFLDSDPSNSSSPVLVSADKLSNDDQIDTRSSKTEAKIEFETNDKEDKVKIDYSIVNDPNNDQQLSDFDKKFISRISEKMKIIESALERNEKT
ncbi:MAG: hypothetical protein ACXACK_02260 [Candidatus Hodarchaeales archaeon]|jgi:hypothetical protein